MVALAVALQLSRIGFAVALAVQLDLLDKKIRPALRILQIVIAADGLPDLLKARSDATAHAAVTFSLRRLTSGKRAHPLRQRLKALPIGRPVNAGDLTTAGSGRSRAKDRAIGKPSHSLRPLQRRRPAGVAGRGHEGRTAAPIDIGDAGAKTAEAVDQRSELRRH